MISLFTDRYKISLILATLFVLGIGMTLFMIYSIPSGLHLPRGYEPELTKVYLASGATFLIGAFTLLMALRYKKEVIVFRDRALDAAAKKQDGDQEGKTTISLENLTSALEQGATKEEMLQSVLRAVCLQIDAGQGALYVAVEEDSKRFVELTSGYALTMGESTVIKYEFGEGLIGQSAVSGNTLYIDDIPEGYIKIVSGLGSASPTNVLIVPIKQQDQVLGIIELASFTAVSENQRRFVEEAAQLVADKISTTA